MIVNVILVGIWTLSAIIMLTILGLIIVIWKQEKEIKRLNALLFAKGEEIK